MNFNQNDLVKYVVIGGAALAGLAVLNSLNESAAPAPPVRAAIRPNPSDNLDFAGSYYGEDDDDDYYAYQGDDEDNEDYYGYAGEDMHGPPGGMHPGDHPSPPPGTGGHPGGPPPGHGFPGGHPGPITPHTNGHPGGWKGFQLGHNFFDLHRYHITNPIWNWIRRNPQHGFFPATHQLGFPFLPHSYPNMSNPFLCYKFPWSMMPQCRNKHYPHRPFRPGFHFPVRRPPFHFPGGHPGMPGHPGPFPHPGGPPGHPGMPGPGH